MRSFFLRIIAIFMHLHFHAMYESCYKTTNLKNSRKCRKKKMKLAFQRGCHLIVMVPKSITSVGYQSSVCKIKVIFCFKMKERVGNTQFERKNARDMQKHAKTCKNVQKRAVKPVLDHSYIFHLRP